VAFAGRTHLGRYRLVRQVRAGQTCQIWLAHDGATHERVALKVLKEEYRKSRHEIGQLKHEYTVGRDLQHPRVIRVIEFSIVEGVPFLVLEYYGVRNLKQILNDRVDRLSSKIDVILQEGTVGLEYLHQHGWLHRDVKPDNFMLGDDGHVKLIDFSLAKRAKKGIARLLGGRSKIVQGTRSYMSPEQIRGETLDIRSDVYSWGCTLFELVNGRPPYTGESADELLNKHLKASVPLLTVTQDNVTDAFAELVSRMMSKRRKERPDSMADLMREFQHVKVFTHLPLD